METPDRLKILLAEIARRYPDAWKRMDEFREERGKSLPMWPEWCFCPLAGAFAITSRGMDPLDAMRANPDFATDIAIVGALAAWRVTQGIYRFHPELFNAVWDTPLDAELPVELLFRLPEWCVYVETPGKTWLGDVLHGFFCHLEWDSNDQRQELRILLDTGERLVGIPLHLAGGTILGAVERAVMEADRVMAGHGMPGTSFDAKKQEALAESIKPLVSLVLYLCSVGSDLRDQAGTSLLPRNPKPVKTKKGERLFPAERQRTWEVGFRIGAALQRAYQAEERTGTGEGTHAGPRPHIRRAHWHTYITGPRREPDKQRPVVKWLPPIPVAMGDVGELVPTVRKVR